MYEGKTEKAILRYLYGDKLDSIEHTYHYFANILINQRELDKWIRQNISQYTEEIAKTPLEKVKDEVHMIINGVISEKNYQKFTDMGLLSAETIRLKNSSAINLDSINAEFEQKIVACIEAYIQEAKIRMQRCDDAYEKFDAEVKKKNDAIAEKQKELNSLGIFSLLKKKELKNIISNMEKELYDYKLDNEPKDLQREFERMYG